MTSREPARGPRSRTQLKEENEEAYDVAMEYVRIASYLWLTFMVIVNVGFWYLYCCEKKRRPKKNQDSNAIVNV